MVLHDVLKRSHLVKADWGVGGNAALCRHAKDPIETSCGRALIAHNALFLGVPHLEIVDGEAPAALADLAPNPDAIFVGGGFSAPGLLQACWKSLPPGGRLVANAVTLEAEEKLLRLHGEQGGDLVRIAVARAEPVGRFSGFKPLMQITQYAAVKP